MIDLSKLPSRDCKDRAETLHELFPRDMADALLTPCLAGLVPLHSAKDGYLSDPLQAIHSIDKDVRVRRVLLIGATEESRKAYDKSARATPIDDLAFILGGEQSISSASNCCPESLLSESPRISSAWAKRGFNQREAISLNYVVKRIEINDRTAEQQAYDYLHDLKEFNKNDPSAERDLLLIVIEGVTYSNLSFHSGESVFRNKELFLKTLSGIMGYKFIVDFSEESPDTMAAFSEFARPKELVSSARAGRSAYSQRGGVAVLDGPPNFSTGMFHNDSAEPPIEVQKIGLMVANSTANPSHLVHTQNLWDGFLNERLFAHSTGQMRLTPYITQNIDSPLIPQLSSYFNVVL